MKKQLLSLLVLASLVACAGEKVSVEIKVNPVLKDVEIHSELVKDYFKQENYDYKDMDPRVNARTNLGDNLPIHITWSATNIEEKENLTYEIELIDKDYQGAFYTATKPEIDFINYKLNTEYNMHVALKENDKVLSETDYTFTTPDGLLRTITIDGVPNFRDLGDGKHLKQGMIYRSATLANNTIEDEEHPTAISELGIKQLESLKLKCRFDLRKEEEKGANEPVIIKKVVPAPLYYGGENILTYNKGDYNNPEMIKAIFTMLSDPNSYPADIHCVRGTDRTGCIAFLIKGLLGFEWEDLYRDFLFSNFYNIGSAVKKDNVYYSANPSVNTRYGNVIDHAEGETLKEKIYNYLSSEKIGVSTEILDTIIRILKA